MNKLFTLFFILFFLFAGCVSTQTQNTQNSTPETEENPPNSIARQNINELFPDSLFPSNYEECLSYEKHQTIDRFSTKVCVATIKLSENRTQEQDYQKCRKIGGDEVVYEGAVGPDENGNMGYIGGADMSCTILFFEDILSKEGYATLKGYYYGIDYSCESDNECGIKNMSDCSSEKLECTSKGFQPDPEFVQKLCSALNLDPQKYMGRVVFNECKCIKKTCTPLNNGREMPYNNRQK